MKERVLCLISLLVALSLSVGVSYGGAVVFSGNRSIPTGDLEKITVSLSQGEGGLIPDSQGKAFPIGELDASKLSTAGVSALLRAVSEYYQAEEILATRAVVTRASYEASIKGEPLVVKVIEGKISKTRIVVSNGDQAISPAKRERIEEVAPLQVGQTISVKDLDGTVGMINRFSRQQIRPVLIPEGEDLVLEYRIKQLDEQIASISVDNYGAERTGRERASLDLTSWNSLTLDDKFHLKALTTLEGNSSFFGVDYLLPLDSYASSRLALNLSYSKYVAEELGLFGPLSVDFEGDSLNAGLTWERTFWSGVGQFLDGSFGLRYLDVSQDQSSIGIPEVRTGFLLPSLALRYSRNINKTSFVFGGRVEGNLADLADTASGLDLSRQGRLYAEESFLLGSAYGAYRCYLDEFFTGHDGRQHELSILASATSSFGARLAPSFLTVAGGFSSVRGYPLGAASGDSAYLFKLDYKYHFDSFDLGGLTSDFSIGLFSDAASVKNEKALAFERDDTLLSVGLGLDAVFNDDVRASAGYGVARQDSGEVESGDGEFYFQAGFSF